MPEKCWKRLDVLRRLADGRLLQEQAVVILGVGARQVRRLEEKFEARGEGCLVHGNKGRSPVNRTPDEMRRQVVELLRGKYVGFNDTHFTEKLAAVEGLRLGRSTVQRLARGAGVAASKPRRSRRYRSRREREAQAGMMLLWDGSRHDWLEGRGPYLCLMGAIDDATGELMPGAHFVEQECAAGYLKVLAAVVEEKGIPQKLYMDRHGSLKRNDDYWTIEEELAGEQVPTQVGMAIKELGIEPIYALSPQAKGRVERLWGTLQDRLVSELRLAGVATLEGANEKMASYRHEFNKRFGKPARASESAWRRPQRGFDIAEACSFRYEATVGNDNVVSLGGLKLQIPRPAGGRSYAQARVQVHQLMNGRWRIRYQGERIAELTVEGTHGELRARRRHRHDKKMRAFKEGVRSFNAPRAPRARPKAGSRAGRPAKPYNSWTKQQKQLAAKKSKLRRSQRPKSW